MTSFGYKRTGKTFLIKVQYGIIEIMLFTKTFKMPIITYLKRMKNGFLTPTTGKIINWDKYSKTPHLAFYSNNTRYEIWYENKENLDFKTKEIVKQFNLKGIAFWQLGMEENE